MGPPLNTANAAIVSDAEPEHGENARTPLPSPPEHKAKKQPLEPPCQQQTHTVAMGVAGQCSAPPPHDGASSENLVKLLAMLTRLSTERLLIVKDVHELVRANWSLDLTIIVPVQFGACCSAICAIEKESRSITFLVNDHPDADSQMRNWLNCHIRLSRWKITLSRYHQGRAHSSGEITIGTRMDLTVAALATQHFATGNFVFKHIPDWQVLIDFSLCSKADKQRLEEELSSHSPGNNGNNTPPLSLCSISQTWVSKLDTVLRRTRQCLTHLDSIDRALDSRDQDAQWFKNSLGNTKDLIDGIAQDVMCSREEVRRQIDQWQFRLTVDQ